jgi:hypothetical protein
VFTHDIYFLCILEQEATALALDFVPTCIRGSAAGYGAQTDRVPFDKLSTSKRVKALRQMHDSVARAHKSGDDERSALLTRDAYYHLRMAWERGVEEVLLHDVVTRFGEGVSTQRLRAVVIEDVDYVAVDTGMTKSSRFAHDPASAAMLPTPHPDELRADIEALETWRTAVDARKRLTEVRRA